MKQMSPSEQLIEEVKLKVLSVLLNNEGFCLFNSKNPPARRQSTQILCLQNYIFQNNSAQFSSRKTKGHISVDLMTQFVMLTSNETFPGLFSFCINHKPAHQRHEVTVELHCCQIQLSKQTRSLRAVRGRRRLVTVSKGRSLINSNRADLLLCLLSATPRLLPPGVPARPD